jgi:hypothetical protein
VGLITGIPLLAVAPFGVALTAAAVWLLIRRKQMLAKLQAKSASSTGETTITTPKT